MPYGVYIPVGPSCLDLSRTADVIESICIHEPSVARILVIDHGPSSRNLEQCFKGPAGVVIETIKHCVQTNNGDWLGAGCVTNLFALEYFARFADIEFVLKLDADALVIGPFANEVIKTFNDDTALGIAGTLGTSCNRENRSFTFDTKAKSLLQRAVWVGTRLQSETLDNFEIVNWNLFTEQQIQDHKCVFSELAPIFAAGFQGEHCQGGAYAISATFIKRMKEKGFLEHPHRWLYIPVGEDRMMGAYCAAVDLKLCDLSDNGQPFGVQNVGLPFQPEELLKRKYKVIHSLRNNKLMTESAIRAFFRSLRLNS